MNHIIIRDTCYNIRKGAREALAGQWKSAIIASLLFLVVTSLPSLIFQKMFGEDFGAVVSLLYSLAVAGPFTIGYSFFILKLFRNEYASPGDVFSGFDRYGKAVALYFLTALFVLLWTLLLVIPGIVAAYRYRLAYFILLDNPQIGALEAINESKRLMTGNKGKAFLLDLSFIGWFLLCAITLGLGMIVLYPYMMTAYVAFYELANGNLTARDSGISYGNPQVPINDYHEPINYQEPVSEPKKIEEEPTETAGNMAESSEESNTEKSDSETL